MKNKINYWKVLSIIFIVLIVILSFVLYSQYNSYYEFGGVKIKQSTINDFSEVMGDKPFRLCDTIQNKCMIIGRIK